MTHNEGVLRGAILGKKPIVAIYAGHMRHLCPHKLGYKGGKLHLLSYQYAGDTSSGSIVTPRDPDNGPPANWRCMEVELLEGIDVLPDGVWYTCSRHFHRQTCIDEVIVQVALGQG